MGGYSNQTYRIKQMPIIILVINTPPPLPPPPHADTTAAPPLMGTHKADLRQQKRFSHAGNGERSSARWNPEGRCTGSALCLFVALVQRLTRLAPVTPAELGSATPSAASVNPAGVSDSGYFLLELGSVRVHVSPPGRLNPGQPSASQETEGPPTLADERRRRQWADRTRHSEVT